MASRKTTARTPADRPETVRQARTWETVKGHYEDAGLDGGCAGQAAYGHQLGFAKVNPPCDHCSYIVLPRTLIARHGIRGQQWLHGHFTKATERPGE
jgi:hypothetical protein